MRLIYLFLDNFKHICLVNILITLKFESLILSANLN